MVKYKMLCDRCYGDAEAFKQYSNQYNNGKCFKCNGHGYILTKDEMKAKRAHIEYLPTLQRKISQLELVSKKEIEAIQELESFRQNHINEHKELYTELNDKTDEWIQLLQEGDNDDNKDKMKQLQDECIELNKQWNATMTREYKMNESRLEKEVKIAKKKKENAIKELEKSQQFYIFLLEPVKE